MKKNKNLLIKTHKRTIDFINSFHDRIKEIHPNLDFTNSLILDSKTKIEYICKIHGKQYASPTELLLGKGCKKCGYLSVKNKLSLKNKKNLLLKLRKIHNDKYKYLNIIDYENNRTILKIECPIHGIFEQKAHEHLSGCGCRKCSDFDKKGTWSYSEWERNGKSSKYFDSFKVYILKCWNNNEEFYKIGKTFKTVENRFAYKKCMPYNYSIIKIIIGNAKYICELEHFLKISNKNNLYTPKIKFVGMTECFKELNIREK